MVLAPLSFAFGLSMCVACLMRLVGGPEYGRVLATGGIPVGFLAGVAWISGLPSADVGSFSGYVLYTVLGGACLGIVLDILKVQRLLRTVSIVGFVGLCVWMHMGFPTHLPRGIVTRVEFLVAMTLLFVSWLVILLVLDRHQARAETAQGFIALLAMAVAIGAIAAIYRAEAVVGPAFVLVFSVAAVALLVYPLGAQLSSIVVLGGGGALFGLIQGMGARWPGSLFPLALASLCLFAAPTARRIPGPARLRVVWTCVLAIIPLGMSLLISLSLHM